MDELPNAPALPDEPVSSSEPAPRLAPPSTSVLSDAPTSDALDAHGSKTSLPQASAGGDGGSALYQAPQLSAQTESILQRVNSNATNAAATGTPGWEAAKEQVMKDMQTSDAPLTSTPPANTSISGKADESVSLGAEADHTGRKMEGETIEVTPKASGRGRGGGRPRGRGRGGGRGGKRKREDKSDDDSEDSEVYSPAVTMTKSGRSVQKPSNFVPPPPSPPSANKRKRPYRRNPESAVCKVCLRGTSPASNMIVFCDGCNTPYHRYCHHPPIDQAVVDEVDKEWYCKQCEKERVMPVPESDVANFISAEGASLEQRQRYFSSLSPGMLVTLLTKATSLRPDLPLFPPDFQARMAVISSSGPPMPIDQPSTNHGHAHSHPSLARTLTGATYSTGGPPPPMTQMQGAGIRHYSNAAQEERYGPDEHPAHYPRPGHGLMRTLPPEQEDLQWLVDDGDRFGVFSHMYQVDPRAANAGMNVGHMHMGQPYGGP